MDRQKQATANQNSYRKLIKEPADQLLDESKRIVGDMYNDGLKKIDSVQKEALDYTEEFMDTVRKNPLKSVLIAGGIGLLLSMMIKK